MRHLDPETAALLALGEQSTSASERAHVEACATCRHEVAELQETVTVARSTLGEAELQEPPARVWQGIQRELGLSREVAPSAPPPVLSQPYRPAPPPPPYQPAPPPPPAECRHLPPLPPYH